MPNFDRSFLDELAARNDILSVVSQYVQLKKQGANYFGLCPFHSEKSPSFSVAPDKQIYHCFGCGAGGGVINFVMRAEGLTFPEAVESLAKRAGMSIPTDQHVDPNQSKRRARVLALLTDAARFYYAQLRLPENKAVLDYFYVRGLHPKIMKQFGLGFAPNSYHATMDAMQAKGYSRDEMLDAGLLAKNEKGNIYDKFRNRVMFPIIDIRGQVIAFGGRVMDDSKPKYLNSPETQVYHKSRNLFALNIAKKTDKDYIILAEGYMDVIALHQAGFTSAVASLGTALTDEQARLMARFAKQVVISYDADAAGQKAAQRAIDILRKADLQVKVLRIPGAKDPDEYIKSKGPDAFRRLIEQSEGHNLYRLEQIAAPYDLEEDEQRIQFLADAARMLATLENPVEREIYTNRAAQMAKVTADAMAVQVKNAVRNRTKQQKKAEHRIIQNAVAAHQPSDNRLRYPDMKLARLEEGILGLLFADNTLIDGCRLQLPQMSTPVLGKFYTHACEIYAQGYAVTMSAYDGYFDVGELDLLSKILTAPVPHENRQQALQDSIDKLQLQQALRGQQQVDGEDPLLILSKKKAANTGGNKI